MLAQVYEQLWIGDIDAPQQIEIQWWNKDWYIIRCCEHYYERFPYSPIPVLSIPFKDEGQYLTKFNLEIAHIFAADALDRGNLLVHCLAGSNRSTMICAYLLCVIHEFNANQAMELVKKKNPNWAPQEELVWKLNNLIGADFKIS